MEKEITCEPEEVFSAVRIIAEAFIINNIPNHVRYNAAANYIFKIMQSNGVTNEEIDEVFAFLHNTIERGLKRITGVNPDDQ